MITAIDSSVLLDVFGADSTFGPRSKEAVRQCLTQGTLIACEVVWAEVRAWFPSSSAATEAMEGLGVEFAPLDQTAALIVGEAWRSYRRRGGKKTRIVADFLIGAHAQTQAERLLTRDRGFYRSYFKSVSIVDPAV